MTDIKDLKEAPGQTIDLFWLKCAIEEGTHKPTLEDAIAIIPDGHHLETLSHIYLNAEWKTVIYSDNYERCYCGWGKTHIESVLNAIKKQERDK